MKITDRITYPSPRLAFSAIKVPWTVTKTVGEYYTTGTIYTKTDPEFENSVVKNVTVAVLASLAVAASVSDAKLMPYPMYSMFKSQKGKGAAKDMPGFGETVDGDKEFLWVVKPSKAKYAILYLHGGGYSFPLAPAQLIGMMGVWWALSPDKRENLAIAVLDYHLTTYRHYYPTQIFETIEAYRKLTAQGYEVILLGDSCGTNLALAAARFAAYPEEAKNHFSEYTQFNWDFLPLQPVKYLILLAPWILPTCAAKPYPGVNHKGEFVALSINEKGWDYIKNLDRAKVTPFVEFNSTNYKDHWAEVPAFNGKGSVLYIYGEREYFRESQESFAKEVGHNNFTSLMQPGGIHDCLFVAEVLDLKSSKGQRRMIAGEHRKKYNFGAIADYLEDILP